ncbi:MAG: sigma-54 dependent transcriptional regulator [Firmicutes bacterium]|nr:sigma-54 dependent transcriptional regulator [Bacillota bacterium]
MKARILVADDDPGMRETLEAVLAEDGYDAGVAASGAEAMHILAKRPFDVMLLDLKMPDITGLELLSQARRIAPEMAVIMMTAFGTVKIAVEAVKEGAYDFLTKPFELDEMRLAIKKALEMQGLARENRELRRMLDEKFIFKEIVGASKKMQEVFEVIRKVVDYDVIILISGESGTGKELVAQAIHYNSSRRDKPFVKLNCAALPETLLESELFGYDRGAFTGATTSKPGRFELAEGGTLFLDEIGDTSPNMQAKLLRVLQEKEFERVGGRETLKADVRIVAATNKDLKREVEARRFREDLYYRLNVVPIHLPPLRERKEDLPALARHFLKELNLLFRKDFSAVSPEAMACLLRYQWPGNIRELRNVLEKAVLLGEGKAILAEHLPDELQELDFSSHLEGKAGEPPSLDDLEKEHIFQVLREAKWNQTRAAELLGIHRNTLRKKIERFNLKEMDT